MRKILLFLSLIVMVVVAIVAVSKIRGEQIIPNVTLTVDAPHQSSPPPNSSSPTNSNSQSNTTGLKVAQDLNIEVFADTVPAARDLQLSPGDSLLVSELSAGKVESFRLSDKKRTTILQNLKRPHGLAFYNGKLFVAEEEQLKRYAWDESAQTATFEKTLFKLPKGGLHNTRSIAFDQNGKLYVSIGSTCNVCQEKDPWYAAVIVSDSEGNSPQVFSSGLRNSVFLKLNQHTNQIWGSEMGRDMLGDTTPPDELNILQQNQNYGWPDCYADKVTDTTQHNKPKEYCATTTAPIHQFHAHNAPLGLTFVNSPYFPPDWQGDLLVSLHGSWNSSVPVGYKIVHLKVSDSTVTQEEDFVTGFINGRAVSGRPVDLEFDQKGNLYVSDDKAGKIYRIFK